MDVSQSSHHLLGLALEFFEEIGYRVWMNVQNKDFSGKMSRNYLCHLYN
jgi:hypothetical protein